MKLWILESRQDRPNKGERGIDPWQPWFDKAFGFVVRAETEDAARRFAHEDAGDENCGGTKQPWLEAKYSTCIELSADGEAGVIIRDFEAA